MKKNPDAPAEISRVQKTPNLITTKWDPQTGHHVIYVNEVLQPGGYTTQRDLEAAIARIEQSTKPSEVN